MPYYAPGDIFPQVDPEPTPAPEDENPWDFISDIFTAIYDQSLNQASGSTYMQQVSAALAQDQFDFSKTQWADQLGQWNEQFGFSKSQFETSTQLQRDQMTQSAEQFMLSFGLSESGQQQAQQQFLDTMVFNRDQFAFSKDSFTEQLDFSKLQFEEQMGFSYDQLEQQLGMQENQLTFQREQLAASASQFAAEMGLRTEEMGLRREVAAGQLELGKGQLALGTLAEAHDYEIAKGGLALSERAQSFQEKTINTQMLMEAAGLAASPTGAIQLAYMARNAGAPSGAIADIFSNLPFVQAALAGKTLPGFGVPEQLGGTGGGGGVTADMDSGALVNAALGPEGGGSPSSGGGAGVTSGTSTNPGSTVDLYSLSEAELKDLGISRGAEGTTRENTFYSGVYDPDGNTTGKALKIQGTKTNLQNYDVPGGVTATPTAMATTSAETTSTGTAAPTGNIFKRGLGVELPSLTSLTQEQWGGMKSSEKLFLGALYQSETGIPIEQVLGDIQKSFIPTAQTTRLSF